MTTPAWKYAAATAFFLLGAQALAGPPILSPVGSVTHGPLSAAAVPMLGGVGLVVLSALLGMVSLRFLKDRARSGGLFLVTATVTGALAMGGSGIKLISDSYAATPSLMLTNSNGATVNIPFPGFTSVLNDTGSTQRLEDISTVPGCVQVININGGDVGVSNGGGVGNGGNGGFVGTCSDSPPTVLGDLDYCEIYIECFCVNGGGNGGNGGCGPI